jgi:hypothetical protein
MHAEDQGSRFEPFVVYLSSEDPSAIFEPPVV